MLKLKMLFNFENDGNAPPEALSTTLDRLQPGDRCEIESMGVEGPVGVRLEELGFLPGTEVRMVRRAPLGDPVVYELRGAQLCLRAREARSIHVRRLLR